MTDEAGPTSPTNGTKATGRPCKGASGTNGTRGARIADWDRRKTQIDRRTVAYQRYESTRRGIISDLGGDAEISTGQAELTDKVSFLLMSMTQMEAAALAGQPIDLQAFGELLDRCRRSLETLGLKRVPKPVLSLQEHLARLSERQPEPPTVDDDTDAQTIEAAVVDEDAA